MGTREEVKAGIVIAVSLVVLAALVVGVSGVSLLERYDRYTVRLRSSGGLDQGSPVRLGGLKVGRVLGMRISPADSAQVEITLGIRQGTVIPQGTWAGVATLGLLGDTFLQLTTERHNPQRIPPGSEIPGREAPGIADLVQRLQRVADTTETVLSEVGTILNRDVADLFRRVNGIADSTQETLTHIDAFVAPANRERVEKILATVDQAVQEGAASIRVTLEHVTAAAQRMDATLQTVEGLVAENRGDLREAARLLRSDLDRTGEVLLKLDQTLGSAERTLGSAERTLQHADEALLDNRDSLDETLAHLRRSAQNLRELTQSLKERPWSTLFPAATPEKPGTESRR
ncbi:MAG TPA: MlaD family protein [Candidatus Methylomirabilis sp.]|nr:MlaD family protein [Candidatus Methylomirabilis sp.]